MLLLLAGFFLWRGSLWFLVQGLSTTFLVFDWGDWGGVSCYRASWPGQHQQRWEVLEVSKCRHVFARYADVLLLELLLLKWCGGFGLFQRDLLALTEGVGWLTFGGFCFLLIVLLAVQIRRVRDLQVGRLCSGLSCCRAPCWTLVGGRVVRPLCVLLVGRWTVLELGLVLELSNQLFISSARIWVLDQKCLLRFQLRLGYTRLDRLKSLLLDQGINAFYVVLNQAVQGRMVRVIGCLVWSRA